MQRDEPERRGREKNRAAQRRKIFEFRREVESAVRQRRHRREECRGAKRQRVLRGGSWNNNERGNLLSSNRNHNTPGNRNNNGFRQCASP